MARTDGGNHPHRNLTSPHAYGVAVNAVKRSNRKYQYTNQEIIAGQLAFSTLPQLVFVAHTPLGLSPFQRAVMAYPAARLPLD
ncbi:hypothetical protein [Candidatus Galacturonibacter soehngenii]|uniref:hypothetical protein n=1 Tax=Candidatus Galacturonatibacter soehngenii TaxID=2307010 RepID=UPI001247AFB9|nr:hypothetical protein [Candidatus Galacturonibacter soehngenii]